MIQFTSYQKIRESSASWNLNIKQTRKLQKLEWCVTEKIHGANFCWIVTETEILCAKRKKILTKQDEFFNYQAVREKLSSKIKELFINLNKTKKVDCIYIYGELFGGSYPHPDILSNLQFQPIQTGVYYSPNIEFCGFDIAINTSQGLQYLDYDRAIELFTASSLLYAKPLFIGKMQDALNYPIRFSSTIPLLLNLPALEIPNLAEGVVIKPIKSVMLETSKGLIRPILKHKITEFAECDRYHQAEKWQNQTPSNNLEANILNELEWDIYLLVTENRINNAISKVGFLKKETKEEIRQLLKQDVKEELQDKYGNRFLNLTTSDMELIDSVLEDKIEEELNKLTKQENFREIY